MKSVKNPAPREQKETSLEMLYSIVASINLVDDQEKMVLRILEILKDWTDASAVSMYRRIDDSRLGLIASLGFAGKLSQSRCLDSEKHCPCRIALAKGHIQQELARNTCCGNDLLNNTEGENIRQISIPVQTRNRSLGVINIMVVDEILEEDEDWVVMLTSIGQNLGLAIERSELEEDSIQLSRIEERTFLAHELHDSLAQTLASIRYQLRVLDHALKAKEENKVWKMLDVVENNVEEANKELRELISRFRAPADQLGLIPSIEDVIQRFKDDTDVKIVFQNSLSDVDLPLKVESQIVRIIQEALTNIRKHANPRTVRVMMRCDEQTYHVLIEDDGIGFDYRKKQINQREHIGLLVMSERASRIGGKLHIESALSEGTRVHLEFPAPEAP
jgi:two-component system nitrate/nitrite sensor histidine kinase NarX